ncbi:MAG: pilin [Candidatus Pacebacteria bacterium]|nr:pilin [Candidatus Paceibacterota bacterium]MDD5356824.1 pilin [Candidatus Paceibacterota bacterium]
MKTATKIYVCILCLVLCFGATHKALAFFQEQSYKSLAPIEGVNSPGDAVVGGVNLATYLGDIFKLGIGLCGIFAVLMIVVGGLEYVMTDKIASKEDAKTRITNAIIGLLLALSSYVILYTINPALVSLDFLNSTGGGNVPQTLSVNNSAPDQVATNPVAPASKPGDTVTTKPETPAAPKPPAKPKDPERTSVFCFYTGKQVRGFVSWIPLDYYLSPNNPTKEYRVNNDIYYFQNPTKTCTPRLPKSQAKSQCETTRTAAIDALPFNWAFVQASQDVTACYDATSEFYN